MMPFGNNLRADDNVDPAFGNQFDGLANAGHPAGMVGRQNRGSGFRKTRGHFLGNALNAWPAGDKLVGGPQLSQASGVGRVCPQ